MGCVPSSISPLEVVSRVGNDLAITDARHTESDPWTNKAGSKKLKLLLLGVEESGKTTFLKQIRILHASGFSTHDRNNYVQEIRRFAARNLLAILDFLHSRNISFEDEIGVKQDRELLNSYEEKLQAFEEDMDEFNLMRLGGAVTRLWASREVQSSFAWRNIDSVFDSAPYFLRKSAAIFDPFYLPTNEDILHCRLQTKGVSSMDFTYSGLQFELFDVGGQKTERKKWIHCFENISAVIFVAALSDYDICKKEDGNKNRLLDSIVLFRQICNNRWFENSTMILFLNKIDIFIEKLANIPICVCFEDYAGPDTFQETSEYISNEFKKMNETEKPIYSHFTCATDTNSFSFIFETVMKKLIIENLKNVGLH